MTKKMMAKLIGIDSKKMVKILIVGTLVIVVTLIGIFILNNDLVIIEKFIPIKDNKEILIEGAKFIGIGK